jgi:hypothetical protein
MLADPGKKLDPITKITKAKSDGTLAVVTEYLPRKHEALSSKPSITKKRNTFKYL